LVQLIEAFVRAMGVEVPDAIGEASSEFNSFGDSANNATSAAADGLGEAEDASENFSGSLEEVAYREFARRGEAAARDVAEGLEDPSEAAGDLSGELMAVKFREWADRGMGASRTAVRALENVGDEAGNIDDELRDIGWSRMASEARAAADRVRESFEKLNREVDATSFGHSPGGLESIREEAAKAEAALKSMALESGRSFAEFYARHLRAGEFAMPPAAAAAAVVAPAGLGTISITIQTGPTDFKKVVIPITQEALRNREITVDARNLENRSALR
jgi:hypothetical protein